MPWNETTVMDERCRFVLTYLRGDVSMSELCVEHGISRPTGYKWVERYEEAGPPVSTIARAPLIIVLIAWMKRRRAGC